MKVGFLIGLGIVIVLVGWQGFAVIGDRMAGAGWGIFLIALFIPPDLLLRVLSFQLLFTRGRAPRIANTALAMWIGSSVNFLLPVATVGGEFVKARILTLRSVQGVDAAASVLLDKTVQALSILIWAVIGIVILASVAPAGEPLVLAAIIGASLLAFGIGGFALVQYAGAFGLFARPAAKVLRNDKWQSLIGSATNLDSTVRALYHQPLKLIASVLLRVAKRSVMAGEVWFVAWLLGYAIGWEEAIMLNSLALALRSAAFVVPGGLGIQEGGYIMVGALIGLPPDVMLAISLATRLGEFIEGLPGLIAWYFAEGGSYLRGRLKTPPGSPTC